MSLENQGMRTRLNLRNENNLKVTYEWFDKLIYTLFLAGLQLCCKIN